MSDPRPNLKRNSRSANPTLDGPRILSFPLERRPKATRASLPKVRTGCVTCKKRHVKCDEAKPACDRCVRWRGYCGGYEAASTPPSNYGSDPDSDPGPRSSTPFSNKGKGRTMPIDPSLRLPTEDETHAHRSISVPALLEADWNRICETSATYNTRDGVFPPNFWTQTMPRILRESPPVLYANLAVQAAGLAKRPTHLLLGKKYNGDDMRQRALNYYGNALSLVRNATGGNDAVRNAIVSSLFSVVFEIFNDDQTAAESHFRFGQRMADELHKTAGQASAPRGGRDLYWELHNVLCFLKTQERSCNLERWSKGFEIVGENWLQRDWTGPENWLTEAPLMELAMVKLSPAMEQTNTEDGGW